MRITSHKFLFVDTGLPLFEPACGMGHISNVLQNNPFFQFSVIVQDLFTSFVTEHLDYLKTADPSYSFLITNPPFCLKYEFLEKAFLSGKPFAMLLPIACYFTVRGSALFEKYPLAIFAFRRNVVFEHNGRKTAYNGMAWFVGNMGDKQDFATIRYIDTLDLNEGDDESFSTIGQDDIDVISFAITGQDVEEV